MLRQRDGVADGVSRWPTASAAVALARRSVASDRRPRFMSRVKSFQDWGPGPVSSSLGHLVIRLSSGVHLNETTPRVLYCSVWCTFCGWFYLWDSLKVNRVHVTQSYTAPNTTWSQNNMSTSWRRTLKKLNLSHNLVAGKHHYSKAVTVNKHLKSLTRNRYIFITAQYSKI